ncbi:hypothetical protein B9T31_05665 [Acinetobacter sp. ANC 4558]|uniref:MBL fold metallo-hydrolase n=1 Tax=Acinetobacter sp. ANC 4558 TaxID=1977876 RepID=UPI000A33550E|nr:MBL fold metallo-hydrolase [Acinetobacter sp. ANC 4558]OTG87092.1 hypothetical protein B9T31_05665 [Acinetobacter sp. ANC 4558]
MKKRIWIPTFLLITPLSYLSAMPQNLNLPQSDHYNVTQQQFVNRHPIEEPISFSVAVRTLWDMFYNEKKRAPAHTLPMQKPDWNVFLSNPQDNQFIWFGHSNLLMRVSGKTIAVDPVFGKSVVPLGFMMHRFQDAPAQIHEFPFIDLVIISHNHYDHLEKKTIQYLVKHSPETQYVVPLGLDKTLEKWGVASQNIIALDWWQDYQLDQVKITATEAHHASGRGLRDTNQSLWAGWIIQDTQQTIFYSGDNGYGIHYAEVGRRFPAIDLAFLENGQYDEKWSAIHMSPAQTAQAAKDIGAKAVVPVHWGAYSMALHHWNESVIQSVPLMQSYGIHTLTPEMGQIFTTETQTTQWYKTIP